MRTLFYKELREQAPIGAAAALIWTAWWGLAPPIHPFLLLGGDGVVLVGFASITLGLLLGFAPFEIERRSGMRSFLVHRGVTVRAMALARLVIAAGWTAGVTLAGFAALVLVHLRPALLVPGLVEPNLRALSTTSAIAWPALGAGALAGCLGERTWVRWAALLLLGAGIASWGTELSRLGLLESSAGTAPFLAFCVAAAATCAWVAARRFQAEATEDRPLQLGPRLGSAALTLVLGAPLLLQTAQVAQHFLRGVAWRSNAYWLRTSDGKFVERAQGALPPGPTRTGFQFHPTGRIDLGEGEQLVFHPLVGATRYWDQMLGTRPHWRSQTSWAIGFREPMTQFAWSSEGWHVRIDPDLDRIVTIWRESRWRIAVGVFSLPDSAAGELAGGSLEMASTHSGLSDCVLVLDEAKRVRAVVRPDSGGGTCRALALPDGGPMIERVFADDVFLHADPEPRAVGRATVFVGTDGNYVFDGDEFRRVARFETAPSPLEEERPAVEAIVSDYDGLAYTVTLRAEDDGDLLGSSRIAPRATLERLGALAALASTLARVPASSLASFALHPPDDDGSATPSQSLWIDPLVLGGRRPWLVALHLGVSAALAWSTRRRLGGRAWGWPLVVVLLGLPAWLACRMLEPRRAVRGVVAQRSRLPHWAPIVDRAAA